MIYNLIETATGRNTSQSSVPIENIKAGFHVIETADNIGIWNEATLQFDPTPENKRIVKSTFYKNIGIGLFGKVVAASKSDVEIEILLEYIKGLDTVNLEDPELLYGLNLLVSKGVWTQAEMDGVLSV